VRRGLLYGAEAAVNPICHIKAAPRVPGCELQGKRPHDYGPGRICAIPGCGTTLRRTHKGPVCDPCIYEAKARARATAREVPAPLVRATKEEKVAKESMREVVLLVFAGDPSRCLNAGDVVKLSGISPSCVYKNLRSLVASGDLVKDAPGEYHWPKTEDAKTAPATSPAPAPASMTGDPLGTEQPASPAPAPDPPGDEPRGLAPFAGIDYELLVISEVVRRIESLTGHETRVRVAAYVASRFL